MKTSAFILFFILGFIFLSPSHAFENSLEGYCGESYKVLNYCPEETCLLACPKGVDPRNCAPSCMAKSCFEISAERCPQKYCQLLKGCDGKTVCYDQMVDEPKDCGGLAYAGNLKCCEGLTKRCGVQFFDGTCDMSGVGTTYAAPICLPCGNDVCNQFEDQCNCPEDCIP